MIFPLRVTWASLPISHWRQTASNLSCLALPYVPPRCCNIHEAKGVDPFVHMLFHQLGLCQGFQWKGLPAARFRCFCQWCSSMLNPKGISTRVRCLGVRCLPPGYPGFDKTVEEGVAFVAVFRSPAISLGVLAGAGLAVPHAATRMKPE